MIHRDGLPHGNRCPHCFERMTAEFCVSNSAGTVHVYDCPGCSHMEAVYDPPHRSQMQHGALHAVAGMLRVFVTECRAIYASQE